MKQRKQQKKTAAGRGFLSKFRFGFDFWGLGLFVLLLVPNIVWWCFSPENDVLRQISAPPALDVFAYIFEAVTVAAILIIVRREAKGLPRFDSPFFTFTVMSVVLYIAAWVFYFCGNVNFAVLLFMGVFPCTALGCYAAMRKNWLVLCPLAVFTALHLAWMIYVIVQLY